MSWQHAACMTAAAVMAASVLFAFPAQVSRDLYHLVPGVPVTALCKPYSAVTVQVPGSEPYVIRDDSFRGPLAPQDARVCMRTGGRDGVFRVSYSDASTDGPGVAAFPEAWQGCAWGRCTPGSPYPARLRDLRLAAVSVRLRVPRARARGKWDAALDVWLSRRYRKSGQLQGAEVMIWLAERGVQMPPGGLISIGGLLWRITAWEARRPDGAHWPLIIYRLEGTLGRRRRRISIIPFLRYAEAEAWVRPWYWVASVHAGYELWQGGHGLGISEISFMTEKKRREHGKEG